MKSGQCLAAILKSKMAANRGRFQRVTRSQIKEQKTLYQCTKFHNFIPICGIFDLTSPTIRDDHASFAPTSRRFAKVTYVIPQRNAWAWTAQPRPANRHTAYARTDVHRQPPPGTYAWLRAASRLFVRNMRA